jgi:hypothetical protein
MVGPRFLEVDTDEMVTVDACKTKPLPLKYYLESTTVSRLQCGLCVGIFGSLFIGLWKLLEHGPPAISEVAKMCMKCSEAKDFIKADLASVVTKNSRIMERMADKSIEVVIAPDAQFSGNTVKFSNGTEATYDTVISCTGFKLNFPFLKVVLKHLCPLDSLMLIHVCYAGRGR